MCLKYTCHYTFYYNITFLIAVVKECKSCYINENEECLMLMINVPVQFSHEKSYVLCILLFKVHKIVLGQIPSLNIVVYVLPCKILFP
jgi:hypothetical protein